MAYTTAEGRGQLLDTIAEAVEHLGVALAWLTEAYEALDEHTADRLEEELFRPVQSAYGRARRAHTAFAERHGLTVRTFEPAGAVAPAKGVKGMLDAALEEIGRADGELAGLQDSMLPVEVGDVELRAELEQVRSSLDHLGARTRELVRTFGR